MRSNEGVIGNFKRKLKRKNKKMKRKKNFFFLIKKIKTGKNISRNFSGVVAVSVGSVQFQIAPRSSLHFSISIGPFRCSWCYLQGF